MLWMDVEGLWRVREDKGCLGVGLFGRWDGPLCLGVEVGCDVDGIEDRAFWRVVKDTGVLSYQGLVDGNVSLF